jgi:lipopolysaccharide O-acetyltransferase
MKAFRARASRTFLSVYRLGGRSRAKGFSVLAAGAFASFGSRSVIQPPVRLVGEQGIAIGSDVFVGAGSWLQAIGGDGVILSVGDGTSLAGNCILSAAKSLRIGIRALLARGVYVADHSHAFADTDRAILDQGITDIAPVEIGDGAWLGENVVIGPGVRVGRGAVIGANSVVLDSVPDYCVAVGAPARVVRCFAVNRTA